MGPNNPNHILEETNDVSAYSNEGREVTSGSLVWADGESGEKNFVLNVKPYTEWEIQKTFVIMIYSIEGFPASLGNGEVGIQGGNFTLIVRMFFQSLTLGMDSLSGYLPTEPFCCFAADQEAWGSKRHCPV